MAGKPTLNQVEQFVQDWLAEHLEVHAESTSLPLEVDRLAAHLTRDARVRGITGGDIHRALGDIDVYLTERYLRAAAS
jgi:hypothetical protein